MKFCEPTLRSGRATAPGSRGLRCVATILAALVLAACGRYFAPDLNLDRHVTEKELEGTWSLVTATLELARRGGYAPRAGTRHEIVFRANGTCEFRSLTDDPGSADYLEASGTWRLLHDTGAAAEKKRKNELRIRMQHRDVILFLMEENDRLRLWNFWGDPDSWVFIKYDKKD